MDREKIIKIAQNLHGGDSYDWESLADEILSSQWISVEDRLPEPNERVLALWLLWGKEQRMNVLFMVGKPLNYWAGYRLEVPHDSVTHWQPLPNAPEDK